MGEGTLDPSFERGRRKGLAESAERIIELEEELDRLKRRELAEMIRTPPGFAPGEPEG